MIRLDTWIALFTAMALLWHECGEDLVVFCYRIGLGVFSTVRSRTLEIARGLAVTRSSVRNNVECSIPSFTFFDPSTTPRD
jgi:hypothetical protein